MFIGRERELAQLKDLWRRPAASLVTVRGRRRIGKSTLIEEFARRNRVRFIKIEGIHPGRGVTKVKRGVSMFPELVYAGSISKRIEAIGYFRRIISAENLLGFER